MPDLSPRQHNYELILSNVEFVVYKQGGFRLHLEIQSLLTDILKEISHFLFEQILSVECGICVNEYKAFMGDLYEEIYAFISAKIKVQNTRGKL